MDYSAQSLWDGSGAPVTARVTIQPTGAMGELAQQLRGGGSVEGKPLQFAGASCCAVLCCLMLLCVCMIMAAFVMWSR
jgi:hypothetical protein